VDCRWGIRTRAKNLEPAWNKNAGTELWSPEMELPLAAGEGEMVRILHEALLFCSMAAFAVGVVIAAASLLG
jgi:hypothetical protein